MHSKHLATWTAAVAALVCGSTLAEAAPSLFATAGGTYGSQSQSLPSGSASAASGGGDVYGVVEQRASATYGRLHTYADAKTNVNGTSTYAYFASSSARFVDDWTFDSAGRTGQAGRVTVRFTIDGSLSSTKNGTPSQPATYNSTFANASYRFGLSPQSDTLSQRLRTDGATSGTPFLGIEQVATLDFVFGQTLAGVTLQVTASTAAAGDSTWTSRSISDLEHTANWGGFVDVRDAAGNVISDYAFASASGFDFTQPVPEPATLGLLAGGALLSLRRGRR